jgi:putative pyruvate formate lyase activating enzyme
MDPIYLKRSGELEGVLSKLKEHLTDCHLCPRKCGVDRTAGEVGYCGGRELANVASYGPHYGEERPLVGSGGSGTIFFAGCALKCEFCQNAGISSRLSGRDVSTDELVEIMLSLQNRGCHNINLVTPTHFIPQFVEALIPAIGEGLRLPVVYNTGGYDRVEVIRELEPVVDIFMPDIKFFTPGTAEKFCSAPDYPEAVKKAVVEMHRIVGDLAVDESGIAQRGMIIRHLVMPGGLADTEEVARFVAEKLSKDTYFNLMDQYYPSHRANEYPSINRRITRSEWSEAVGAVREAGLRIEGR